MFIVPVNSEHVGNLMCFSLRQRSFPEVVYSLQIPFTFRLTPDFVWSNSKAVAERLRAKARLPVEMRLDSNGSAEQIGAASHNGCSFVRLAETSFRYGLPPYVLRGGTCAVLK